MMVDWVSFYGTSTIVGYLMANPLYTCPVSWGCRLHRQHLGRRVKPSNECPGYDSKQSDGEFQVMQELWGMRSTHSLPWLTCPHRPGMVAPDRAPSIG